MNIEERIAHHRRIAEGYRNAYLHQGDEYSRFLDVAIGVSGPFHGHSEYVEALRRVLDAAGVSE